MSNKEKEFEKRKILYDTIFDLYKLFLGAGLTLLVAIVVKVAFSEGNPINGLGLVLAIGHCIFSIHYINIWWCIITPSTKYYDCSNFFLYFQNQIPNTVVNSISVKTTAI